MFAALKADGTVTGWGESSEPTFPITGVPTNVQIPSVAEGVVVLTSARDAFAALKRLPCPAGTYLGGTDPLAECEPCTAGTYSAAVGAINAQTCIMCIAGTYSNAMGSTICTGCAAGRYSEAEGATDEGTCIDCLVGRYSTAI